MVGSASAETAADNYNLYCVQCHGTAGTGKGINSPYLAVAPRNHSDPKAMGELSDANVALAIKEGGSAVGKSTQMPSFKHNLTDAEIKDIVALLRTKCKCTGAAK
ncbi:MAG: cytochrome c [Nitrospinae bacterium]|nr:cytochrome c [Nitrospinota bacterium]